MSHRDDTSDAGINAQDKSKGQKESVQYFQEDCPHDPCLRCYPYCPYYGKKTAMQTGSDI
jgi:hypothetical protein